MLSAPRDRRLLVEEAAGLGKHRKRRRRAQLKLERTQDNLDRALDVEREARSRCARSSARPRPPTSTPGSSARRPSCARACSPPSCTATTTSSPAPSALRPTRARRAPSSTRSWPRSTARRTAIEEQLAAARQRAHRGLGPADRGPRRPRADHASAPRRSPRRRADLLRVARPPPRSARRARRRARRGDRRRRRATTRSRAGLERIGESLGAAIAALDEARGAGDDGGRAAGARRGPRGRRARRADGAPGRGHARQPRARTRSSERLEREADAARRARGALRGRRRRARRRRASAPRRSSAGCSARAARTTVTEQLRACSREEAELQAQLRAAGEAVTEAEVRVAHLGDRRAEAAAELERIAATLGRELEPAEAAARRRGARRDRGEARAASGRRREQLGPVNPLAEREYEEALAHVESLETQRADLETALAELQGLIRETDRKIHAAFEETFEATAAQLRGAGRAPVPGRPRAAAPGRRPPRPEAGARRRRSDAEPDGGPDATGREAEEADGEDVRRVFDPGRGDRGHAGGQGDPAAVAALRRREGAGRARLRVRRLPRPARRPSTSSTRSRRRSTTPTSTASCSSSTASPTGPSSSSSPTRSARWTRPRSSTASRWARAG